MTATTGAGEHTRGLSAAEGAVFALAGIGCIAAYLVGPWVWIALALKLVPVSILIAWVARSAPAGVYRRWILSGLGLSLLGDLILALPTEAAFVPGLVAFLLAHLCYIRAFVGDTRAGAWGAAGVSLLVAAGMWSFLYASGRLGPMLIPVTVYTLVIASMLWRALARRGLPSLAGSARLGAIGALLFVTSDGTLAVQKFVVPQAWLTLIVLTTYWLAQYGIAASAVRRPAA